MFNLSLSIGPVNVSMETEDKLSFDAIDSLLSRGAGTTMALFDQHLGSMVKYDNYDNDINCDECSAITEELDK